MVELIGVEQRPQHEADQRRAEDPAGSLLPATFGQEQLAVDALGLRALLRAGVCPTDEDRTGRLSAGQAPAAGGAIRRILGGGHRRLSCFVDVQLRYRLLSPGTGDVPRAGGGLRRGRWR